MADLDGLIDGIRSGRRAAVSRAITLVESSKPEHRADARRLLAALSTTGTTTGTTTGSTTGTTTGPATTRVGISGLPGVGKSTFIEALGGRLTAAGHRVGVLAVDPSSQRTGGSVLGDKTRMPTLAANDHAYVRPSPSAGTLGGVARATSQAMLVLESASYDVVLVETVGVGQSEITVAGMVDTFLFLTLARTGDQLQGIKRGILEIADVIAVNKADGDHEAEARVAARELSGALRMVHAEGSWTPAVVTCSGQTGAGVDGVWEQVIAHRDHLGEAGLADRRAHQRLDFAWALVRDELEQRLRRSGPARRVREQVREQVLRGEMPAVEAADLILAAYDGA